jgi:hypothetical protein
MKLSSLTSLLSEAMPQERKDELYAAFQKGLSITEINRDLGFHVKTIANHLARQPQEIQDKVRARGRSLQSKGAIKKWEDPRHVEKMRRLGQERWKDPKWRKAQVKKVMAGTARSKEQDPDKWAEVYKKFSEKAEEWWRRQGGFWNYLSKLPSEKRLTRITSFIKRLRNEGVPESDLRNIFFAMRQRADI